MKKLKLLFLFLLLAMVVFADTVVPFPGLTIPANIFVEGDYILISQFPQVLIYTLKDFKLHAKFGRNGEGPQEFRLWLLARFHPTDKNLITVSSHTKYSIFTVDGKPINEWRMEKVLFVTVLLPAGNNYILRGSADVDFKIFYRTLELYDSTFKKIKEINRWLSPRQLKTLDPTGPDFFGGEFSIYDNKIFLLIRKKGNIEVYDFNGKKLYSINYDYERVPVTSNDKEAFWQFFRIDPRFREHFDYYKREVKFPEYFNAARRLFIEDNKIYVTTHKKKDDKTETVVFDLSGKFLEKIMLPIQDQNAHEPNPTAIHKGKLYQLRENIETDQWNLVITEIKE